MDVYVLSYSHKHGVDVSVHASHALADKVLAGIARQYWSEAHEYDPEISETPPTDEGELIDTYFNVMMDTEGYVIEPQTVQGALIGILFTAEDAASINEDIGKPVSGDLAVERAEEWSPSIEETANQLIGEQLTNAIENNNP